MVGPEHCACRRNCSVGDPPSRKAYHRYFGALAFQIVADKSSIGRPHPANDVHVTGTFDDWGKTEKLEKVGEVWEKQVQLPSANEKYYYKVRARSSFTIRAGESLELREMRLAWKIGLPRSLTRSSLVLAPCGVQSETKLRSKAPLRMLRLLLTPASLCHLPQPFA